MRPLLHPLLLAILLALGACGASPAAGPTATPIPIPTRAPTAPPPQRPPASPAPTGGTTARRPSLGEAFSIGVGQTVFVDLPDEPNTPALQLRLDGVTNDSRCPRQVACVWAGDATLNVVAQIAGRPAEMIELHTSPQPGGAPLAYGAYAIAVADLQPLAERPEDRIEQGDYRAQLVVTEEGAGQLPAPARK
jgi:hypothetical protein